MAMFRVRTATADDAPALADEPFTVTDGAWFCFVVEDEDVREGARRTMECVLHAALRGRLESVKRVL